jgi:hypothetical protein
MGGATMSKMLDHFIESDNVVKCTHCGEWFPAVGGYRASDCRIESDEELNFCGGACLYDWRDEQDD